jgi:hypothetical protein
MILGIVLLLSGLILGNLNQTLNKVRPTTRNVILYIVYNALIIVGAILL